MRSPNARTDAEIQHDVLVELRWDASVEESAVSVDVEQGVVTLTGTVHDWKTKNEAKEAAHRVADVLDVANDLEVRVPGAGALTDTEIAHALRDVLLSEVFAVAACIHSTVDAGRVTLHGEVQRWSQREHAERAVRNLSGVRSVTNEIAVASAAQPHEPQEEAERYGG